MTWKIRSITIVAPSIKDPRVFMICVLITYTIVGQTLLSFDHAWSQILTALTISCVIDTVVSYRKTRMIILPVSGVITGLGLGLLIEAIPLWPFIVAHILAIGSKAFIKFEGKHIFNPSNFGLTALLLLFPTTVTTLAAQWSGSLLIVLIILMIGGFTSFRVSRWDLVLAFLSSFVIMSTIENLVTQRGTAFVYGPILGAAFQLFTLSMLTDPKTTPSTRLMRVIFGFSIGVIDAILRLWNFQYSLFVALFFVAACVPVLRLVAPVLRASVTSWRLSKNTSQEVPVLMD
jgi:Na+-translocating ferredoxin:NAD+ oxidoreductase RnfD subunit